MTIISGYCYDENGKFTEQVLLREEDVMREIEKDNWVEELRWQDEVLCEEHKEDYTGEYKYDCPNCSIGKDIIVKVNKPYKEWVCVGREIVNMPIRCTLEQPDLSTDPIFRAGKWRPTKVPDPQPPIVQEPSEIDKLKEQVELINTAMTEFIMQQAMRGMDG